MAKRPTFALPASFGGLMRYDEEVSKIRLTPYQVVVLSLFVAAVVILAHLLG